MKTVQLSLTDDGRFLIELHRDGTQVSGVITGDAVYAGEIATRHLKPPQVVVRTSPLLVDQLTSAQQAAAYGPRPGSNFTGD